MTSRLGLTFFILLFTSCIAVAADSDHPPIPVRFRLDSPSSVSLVIENADGNHSADRHC